MSLKSEDFWIEKVSGSRKFSNLVWATVVFLGALSFTLVGFSSYLGKDLIPFLSSKYISFAPQGLVMCFYGIAGFFISLNLWCAMIWNVGSGYNEFDRREGVISVFRWGFPGKNRRIRIRCLIEDVQAIGLDVKDTLGSRPGVSIRLKSQQNIPLIQQEDSFNLREMEEKAAQLARFLRVPIEAL